MAILKRHKNSVFGLNDALTNLTNDISQEEQTRQAAVGDLTTLSTTNKESLVKAINELKQSNADTSGSTLQIANNLSDLADATAARTNISVYSTTETDDAIAEAKLALGTNYTVADLTERDALTDLDNLDRVFVRDSGGGRWSQYKPSVVDQTTGAVTEWTLLASQDALENSITAPAVKSAYETNANTNAYTDAEKQKVGYLTVSEAINLDDAVLKAGLVQDLSGASATDNTASVDAIKAYVLGAASTGGAKSILENVVVVGDTITLTHEPRNGVDGIVNFNTVRLIDENAVAYDAPVQASADPKKFIILTDTMEQWDTKTVKVQYVYLEPVSTAPSGA